MKNLTLFWFRRDLRLSDNLPLTIASRYENTAAIYIYDPEIISKPDFSYLHFDFINDSLIELNKAFLSKGSYLNIYHNLSMDVLKTIHYQCSIRRLISHQQTGNWFQFNQDKQLSSYCKENGIEWLEFQSNGVIRDLKDRDGWSKRWNSEMKKEVLSVPNISNFRCLKNTSGLMDNRSLNIKKINYSKLYKGGESEASSTLDTFLNQRGQYYSKKMSSPLTAFSSCSRLSSYITYGNISIKEVLKIGKARIIKEGKKVALLNFGTRLEECKKASEKLFDKGIECTIIDARFAKPLDEKLIMEIATNHEVLITIEEGSIGGFGSHVMQLLSDRGVFDTGLKFRSMILPDIFIDQDTPEKMYQTAGLDYVSIFNKIEETLNSNIILAKNKNKISH